MKILSTFDISHLNMNNPLPNSTKIIKITSANGREGHARKCENVRVVD